MSAALRDLRVERVVIDPAEYLDGSAMQQADGSVRDLKLIYPETGFDAMSLCLGVVEIDPGHHTPLHRHRCEEVYYVVSGTGELESGSRRHSIGPGCAVLNRPGVLHRVFNTGSEVLKLVAVAGIMLVPLLPRWPTASPYEVLEDAAARAESAREANAEFVVSAASRLTDGGSSA